MVAVGAMAQISSISAPGGLPASVCGGSTVTAPAPSITENPPGSCVGQALELVAINLADNSVMATGAAGTVGSPTSGTLTLPMTASPSTANIAFRYRVTGGVCAFSGTLSSSIAFTPNSLPAVDGTPAQSGLVCSGKTVTVTGASCTTGTLTYFTSSTGSTTTTFPGVMPTAGAYDFWAACVSGVCAGPRTKFTITVSASPDATGSLTVTQSCAGVVPAFTGFTCPTGSTRILVDPTMATLRPLVGSDFVGGTAIQVAGACQDNTTQCIGAFVNQQAYTPTAIPTAPTATSVQSTGVTAASTITVCAGAPLAFNGTCTSGQLKITNGGVMVLQGSAASSTLGSSTTYALTCITNEGCESPTSASVTVNVANPPAVTGTPAQSGYVCAGKIATITGASCTSGTLTYFTSSTGSTTTTFPGVMPTAGAYDFWASCVLGTCEGPRTKFTVTVSSNPDATGSLTVTQSCAGVVPAFTGFTCPTGSTRILVDPTMTTLRPLVGSDFVGGAAIQVAGACQDNTTQCIGAFVNQQAYTPAAIPVSDVTGGAISTTTAGASGSGTSEVVVCASATPGTLAFIGNCSVGALAIWTAQTGGTMVLQGSTAPITPTTYWLSCVNGPGCEGTRNVSVKYTPTVVADGTITLNTPLCKGASLIQTSTTCPSGTTPKFYAEATGSITTSLPGLTPNAGKFSLYVVCVDSKGCESLNRSKVDFEVINTPSTPSLTSSSTSICEGNSVTFSVTGCSATDIVNLYNGTTLVTSVVYGSTSPKTISGVFAAGDYTAKCVSAVASCESSVSSVVSLTVNSRPGKPTFTAATPITPMVVCANTSTGQTLQNNLTCSNSSQVLVWLKGGVQVSQPNTQPAETTTWKVVCKSTGSDGCVSDTTTVVYTVNPRGTNPTGVSLTAAGTTVNAGGNASICSSAATTTITFTGCPSGETLWYLAGTALDYVNSTVTPATQAVGTTVNYRVKCKLGDCFSANESAPMTLTINAQPSFKPVVTLTPATVCATAPASTPFGGSSNCGTFATVWFEVTVGGDVQLASLPATIPATAKTYYAKCKNAADCYSEKSDNVTFSIIPNATAPVITSIGGTEVCTGVNVTLTTNCPSGSVVKWSTGAEGNALALVSAVPQVRAVTAKCVTTVGSTTCESPVSATTTVVWKTFDITIINIGSPLSGVKPGSNVPKSAWAANFVTVDAGPSLQSSSQGNPSVFFTENPNKGADRFWTVHVESCALGTTGAISYDMLVTPEAGVPYSYNTVENNAPYLMYANRDGFTELYAHNHGAYGFTSEPKYTQGLPKGLYKLSIRYWSEKGMGLYPAVRTAQGTQLAYQEYWFRIQSQNGIGSGAAREGVTENTEAPFVTMGQNPVTRTLSLTINGAKGQDVKLNLVDASGRSIKVSSVTPETNTHREEIDMTSQNTGMYFIQVSTPSKRASLKVLKVSQD